jgi:hypothetical protein
MPSTRRVRMMEAMTETTSYAVAWTAEEVRFVGYARLGSEELRLAGGGHDGREQLHTLRYEEVTGVNLVRANAHRELALDVGGERLMLSSLDRPGSLGELAERLRVLTIRPAAQ